MVTVVLDAAQQAVVDADSHERLLVVAGAGRGKTEVVAARIAALESEHDLVPADDIVVLSFSRAAVRAVRGRLTGTDAATAAVSTFDSFAARLLVEADEDLSELHGFDARIRAATEVLRRGDAPDVDLIRHLVLDEVQDLVGDRAEFALALIAALPEDSGFTALGDPLQAIYDWQLGGALSIRTSAELMTALLEKHGARRVALDTDYRARGDDPRAVVRLGDEIRAVESGTDARRSVVDFVWNLWDLGPLRNAADLVPGSKGSTAVLCRTNGEALAVARTLREKKVPHALRRQLEEVGGAAWIAATLGRATRDVLSEQEVRELLAAGDLPMSVDEAWIALKTAEHDLRSPDQLRLTAIRRRMRAGALPLDLLTAEPSGVIVSTVHRAKGLEFDRVVLVDRKARADEDAWTETRTDYVALSRARDEILRCQWPWTRILKDRRSGRWTLLSKKGRSYAMEVISADTDVTRPASENGDADEVQRRLAAADIVGASVFGDLDLTGDVECPRYLLRLADGGGLLGRTSQRFGLDLVRVFGARKGAQTWPQRVDDLIVAAVESVAGESDDTRSSGLGVSGLWLVPRLTGMARPDFPKKESAS